MVAGRYGLGGDNEGGGRGGDDRMGGVMLGWLALRAR